MKKLLAALFAGMFALTTATVVVAAEAKKGAEKSEGKKSDDKKKDTKAKDTKKKKEK